MYEEGCLHESQCLVQGSLLCLLLLSSVVFVLTSTSLQKWYIGDTQEQMVYEAPLEEMIKDALLQNTWVG